MTRSLARVLLLLLPDHLGDLSELELELRHFICMLPSTVLQVALQVESLALDLAQVEHFLLASAEPLRFALTVHVRRLLTDRTTRPIESTQLPRQSLLLELQFLLFISQHL